MSLIACTLNYGLPFLIGDILVTSNEKGTAYIPSIPGDSSYFLNNKGERSHYLAQKSYVVTHNVCIVMAGNITEMTHFLGDLKTTCSYFKDTKVTAQQIAAFIENYDVKTNMAESSFLIFVLGEIASSGNSIELNHFFHGNWSGIANGLFEAAYACGSGTGQFFQYMDDIKGVGDEVFITTHLRDVASRNLNLAAKILATERATHHTILNEWGGGFEMIYLYEGEFVKLDNVSYLLNKAEIVEGGFDFYPERLLHFEYYKDVLFVYALEIKKFEKKIIDDVVYITSSEYDLQLHPAFPIDRKEPLKYDDWPDLSFGTDIIAVGSTFDVNHVIYTPSYVVGEGNTSVRFGHDEKSIYISIPRKMYDFPKYTMNRKVMEIVNPYIKAYHKKI